MRLEFSDESRHDFRDILANIAKDRPKAATEFVELLQDKCRKLAVHPQIGTALHHIRPGLRVLSVRAYVIYFRVAEEHVRIVRIVHGSRDVSNLFPTPPLPEDDPRR